MADEKNPEENCLNNNSIETNDAIQNRERIVDKLSVAEQAEQIGLKLADLETLCKNEIRKVSKSYLIVFFAFVGSKKWINL